MLQWQFPFFNKRHSHSNIENRELNTHWVEAAVGEEWMVNIRYWTVCTWRTRVYWWSSGLCAPIAWRIKTLATRTEYIKVGKSTDGQFSLRLDFSKQRWRMTENIVNVEDHQWMNKGQSDNRIKNQENELVKSTPLYFVCFYLFFLLCGKNVAIQGMETEFRLILDLNCLDICIFIEIWNYRDSFQTRKLISNLFHNDMMGFNRIHWIFT